jgi:thymidine phosphorylase
MINIRSTDDEIIRFLLEIKHDAFSNVEVAAQLARTLSSSGLTFCSRSQQTADVASTGGPSSLSTLLCPLYLRAAGLLVPKLAVPGRPAGGLDCLAQISGYKTELTTDELHDVMDKNGYAHFLDAGRYAPLDARLFSLRKLHGALQVPTLVTASLLSKKIAVGVLRAGLDVRVAPHGNFGSSWTTAKENANFFINAAKLCNIKAFPVLTDARLPYQPYIGRSESLLALSEVFQGSSSTWLSEHIEQCKSLAISAAPSFLREKIAKTERSELEAHFFDNIKAQGGSIKSLKTKIAETRLLHTQQIAAEEDGFFAISLDLIRKALVTFQARQENKENPFPDPAGVILIRRPGEWVKKGQTLATIRVADQNHTQAIIQELRLGICQTSSMPFGISGEGVALNE